MVFWDKYKVLITFVITSVIFLFLTKSCEKKIEEKNETTVNITKIIDSVKQATLKYAKPVYIDTVKTKINWLKGDTKIIKKDSIIYVNTPTEYTIEATEYKTELKSNDATADLYITTTGKLLSIDGTISYPEKTITNTKTKVITKNAGFLYFESGFGKTPERFALGIDYQIKNKLLLGTSIDYNVITNSVNTNFKIGINLWQK